ncbi:S-adenosyl-L-methionine:benzoic acid/salicylic acid carboxyl methyltransferase 1-like [Impatiens glandulifera]|uniref:S-adenosyl-L-methionine:benzoic acid/salicylic acid carboxyl methyltransferase 1-like n=1 Tax=Impatiens glandulifera TaxID=253017 RepID=UPI001FB15770|nr:S-adenosyl-L-methionine:benzoic acid/salicylic acid carboxyl methyltransferase 1-like [Impatiens glandulifera]
MEVIEVLRMKEGTGQTSYANNSLLQKQVINMTMPIAQAAIINVYCNMNPTTRTMCMADLGCSSGPNTLFVMYELVRTIYETRDKSGSQSLEFQVYLNDLPKNDFNTIFKSLSGSIEKMGTGLGPCFIMGAPGSFYGRLFPSKTLHFVYSSYSLMWLSQVPKGIENNKGNIYIGSTSPPSVIDAYYRQFKSDFNTFLNCRSEEVLSGGNMVLTILGRESEDQSSREGYYIWELLAMVLNQMVSEGIIEEGKMDTFNIPQYTPSPGEVKLEVEKEGSFIINSLEVSQVDWSASAKGFSTNPIRENEGYDLAECMRAVAEPMLANHFGESIIDNVFRRYSDILSDRMAKEDPKFYNVTIVMVKK